MTEKQAAEAGPENEEWDCPICLKLLFEPATASCGHSFCRRCAYDLVCSFSERSRPHPAGEGSAGGEGSAWNVNHPPRVRQPGLGPVSLKCPICRASLNRRWTPSPSISLCRLLRQSCPAEYDARRAEEETSQRPLPQLPHAPYIDPDSSSSSRRKVLPLFVLDSILPGQKMILNVFEMRYRLLVQNAVADHGGRFGMVGFIRTDRRHHAHYGTECEIVSCLELPDGRFKLEVKGRSTFKIIDKHARDGYWEAMVQNTDEPDDDNEADDNDDDDDDDNAELRIIAERVSELFEEWEEHVRTNDWQRHPTHLDNLKILLGAQPSVNQPRRLALWMAAAINPLPALGVAKEIRPEVLSAANDHDRLIVVRDALDDSINIVKKRRGVLQIFGLHVDLQILWFGVSGLIFASIVKSPCWYLFQRFGLDTAFLGMFSIIWDILPKFGMKPEAFSGIFSLLGDIFSKFGGKIEEI